MPISQWYSYLTLHKRHIVDNVYKILSTSTVKVVLWDWPAELRMRQVYHPRLNWITKTMPAVYYTGIRGCKMITKISVITKDCLLASLKHSIIVGTLFVISNWKKSEWLSYRNWHWVELYRNWTLSRTLVNYWFD